MKLKFKFISILIILLGFIFASSQAGTFKPFVRSRYSLRWRKTTENPSVLDTSTAGAVVKDDLDKTTKSIEDSEILPGNVLQITTVETKLKTSTHTPDYDYYGNNEVEDGDHKN